MNFGKLTLAFLAGATLLYGAQSCKEDENQNTYSSSFLNAPAFELPDFVQAGEEYILKPCEVERALDDTCTLSAGLFWKVDNITSGNDTVRLEGEDPKLKDGSFKLIIPDTLVTLNVECAAFAKGYYNNYYYSYCTVVDKDKSLTGQNLDRSKQFTDRRDERIYCYTVIGGTDWMSQNIAYKGTDGKTGFSYFYSPVMDELFGRLYSLDEALTICPEGWRLPVQDDFNEMARIFNPSASYSVTQSIPDIAGHMMTDARFNGEKLWEYWPNVTIDNRTGLSALPIGYALIESYDNIKFQGSLKRFIIWTGDRPASNPEEQMYLKYIYDNSADLSSFAGFRGSIVAPVRCVREHQE